MFLRLFVVFLVISVILAKNPWRKKGKGGDFCIRNRRICYKGKLCIKPDSSRYCRCPPRWTGTDCRQKLDKKSECQSMPCQNGGTCTDTDISYTCTCNTGWTGQNCTIKIPACQFMPCQNGGTCQDTDTSYTCTCNTGWTGENCTRFEGDFNHEYALMIMLNHYYASNESSLIYMTTNTSATVEISTSNNMEPSLKSAIDRTFFFTTQLKVTLPPEMQSMSFQKEAKAVKIRSTQPITVVLFDNNYLQSNDGSLIFPVEKLDTRYLVMSTEPRDEMHPIYASVFGIVALEDETLVKINFKLDNNARPLTINGKNYSDSDTFEISLNDLETLQLEHSADLTGTLVEASKPVAVFSGNRCNMFPESIRCSHLMEQMTPISHFGNSYCVSADFTSDVTRLSIMTEESVPTRGAIIVGYSVHSMKLIPRVPFEFTLRANETAYVFLASPRVFVTSLVKGNKNNGSPYMVTIPDTSQYKSQYIIPIPEGYSTNYITILIALRFKADLRLNGQVLQQEKILFEGRNVMNEGMLGSFFTMEVPPGVLNITTITGSPFGLTVFGYRYLDSYGFAGNIV